MGITSECGDTIATDAPKDRPADMTWALRMFLLVAVAAFSATPALAAKHETWVEVRSPHFVIVCNAGEKQARKTAVQFEQIRTLFRQVITIAANAPSPTITIFAVKDEGSLRQLLPEYWAKGHSHPGGIFFSRFSQFYAAIQLDAQGDNPYQVLYHEYYHSLSLPYFPGLPLWLAEGFANFFGNTRIGDKEAYLGQPSPGWIQQLRETRLIPLEVLFAVDHSSPYYNEQDKTSVFYAETWALVHYFMLGDNSSHRSMLFTYLKALSDGASQQDAAANAFGDLKTLQKAIDRYVASSEFYQLTAPVPPRISDAELSARELSEAEADAYLGGFAAVRGHTQEAKPLLEDAIRLDPNLALAYRNLALAEFFAGERTEALVSVSQAVALDSKNGVTRFLRAYLTVMTGGRTRNDSQLKDDLRQTIAAEPNFAPPYSLLATVLADDEDRSAEALAMAQKAISLEPGTAAFQLNLAQVLMRMRRFDEARVIALRARASALSPQEQAQTDQFLTVLENFRNAVTGTDAARPESNEPLPPLRQRVETNSFASGSEDDTRPPQLRHRGQASSALDSHDSATSTRQGPPEVTGTVTQVSCGPGLQLRVTAPEGAYDFHSVPGGQLRITMASKPPGGFNPCSSLKGMRVKVGFDPDAEGHGGTIETLEILAPEEK